jgi:hypothetical protein
MGETQLLRTERTPSAAAKTVHLTHDLIYHIHPLLMETFISIYLVHCSIKLVWEMTAKRECLPNHI